MNARRSQVYTALFRSDGKTITRLMPDSALAISELDALLAEYGESVFFCGDGYDVTLAGIEKVKAEYVPERLRHQSAFSVAVVAMRELALGNAGSDSSLAVNYLRPSQAERERNERLAKENI
jgi:tRNA threonylcarbamoyladenosine biosynthesis protein TsaB